MRQIPGLRRWALLMLVLAAAPASAQSGSSLREDSGQSVGVRAAGMAGAFTAVADDGSAAFWNPAGLAAGSFFSLVIDGNTFDRRSGVLVALGTPPLGLSYYRTAIGDSASGRNTLVAHHAGASLVQSLGDRLAVGATLKLVHGVASLSGTDGISTNKFDADLGVMATGSLAQLGLSVRSLLQPEFKAAGGPIRLDRRVRAGVAIHVRQETTLAADVDLTSASTAGGRRRDAAIGVETHPAVKAWLRGGVHWNASSAGSGAAPVGTIGASYAVYGLTMADVQASFGSSNGDRGWGVGLRMVF